MSFFRDTFSWVRKQAAKVALTSALATKPTPGTLRVNPAAVFSASRFLRNGAEIRWLKTRPYNGLRYRAGRSKYDSPKLRAACEQARLRAHGLT